jgi:hypothetical protein
MKREVRLETFRDPQYLQQPNDNNNRYMSEIYHLFGSSPGVQITLKNYKDRQSNLDCKQPHVKQTRKLTAVTLSTLCHAFF